MRRIIGRIAATNYVSEDYEPFDLGLLPDMLASRKAPGASTDREFFADSDATVARLHQQDPRYAARITAKAKQLGYQPNSNDVYMSQLAKCEGDPLAFVPATGGRHHVKKVCEQRGLGCEGAVAVKAMEVAAPAPRVRLAPKIVDEYVKKYVAKDPSLAKKPKRELREMIVEKHGSKNKE